MKFILILSLSLSTLISGCGHTRAMEPPPEQDPEQKLRARDHYTAGVFYQLENENEKALIEFYQALLYDSTSSSIYNRIAENHMALGRYESALRYLNKSLKLNPENVDTFRLIADCHHRLNQDDRTILYLEKVLQKDPYDQNSRTMLILLYRKNNDQINLAHQYEEMIELYGADEDWVKSAATIYLENGQIDNALNLFRTYLNWDSTNAMMWYSIGTAHELQDDTDEALSAYGRAIEINPEFEQVAQRIYSICRQNDLWNRLIDMFQPLQERYPDILIYRLSLAEAYLVQEDFVSSKALLQPIIDPGDITDTPWQAYELMGRIAMEEEDHSQAATYFRRILEMDDQNRLGWIFLGFALSDMDSLVQAEAHYREAMNYLPDDPFIHSFHGISLNRLGRDEEALASFQRAIELDSTNLNALVSYGITLNRLGRNSEAIEPFENALKVDSTNLSSLSALGMIYDDLQMYEACDRLYEFALKTYPDNELLMNNYAYSLAERGIRLEYALQLALKAVEIQPDNGAYLDTAGWIYYKMGDYQKALTYIQRSVEMREESAVVIEHLGDVHYKLGNINEAKIYWKRALEIDQENNDLRRKIEQN